MLSAVFFSILERDINENIGPFFNVGVLVPVGMVLDGSFCSTMFFRVKNER